MSRSSGVAVEAHRTPDKSVKLADEEIRQVEGIEFVLGNVGKPVEPFKKGITMRAADYFDAHFGAGGLKRAAGAAICIGDKDRLIGGAVFFDGGAHGVCDAFGMIVQDRGQAGQRDMVPAIGIAPGR